jgi:hypothetical protein
MAGPHRRFVQAKWQGLPIARHEHAEHADCALQMYILLSGQSVRVSET